MIGSIMMSDVPTRDLMGDNSFCDVGLATERGYYGHNEDYCVVGRGDGNMPILIALADGIGGEPHGRALSRLACLSALEVFADGGSGEQAFKSAAVEVRSFLRDANAPKSGTTLMIAEAEKGRLRLWWQGDVECLHVREDRCETVSCWHREYGANHVTRSLGIDMTVRPSYEEVGLRPGDTLAFLTDGVSDQLDKSRIMALLCREDSAHVRARALVEEARLAGCDDATAAVVTMR